MDGLWLCSTFDFFEEDFRFEPDLLLIDLRFEEDLLFDDDFDDFLLYFLFFLRICLL